MGANFFQALGELSSQQGNLPAGSQVSGSGFSVVVFTPLAWIAEQASEATEEGRNFTTADVTPDMLRPVLRVWAIPGTKPDTGPNYDLNVGSVANVVITDASRKDKLDPTNRQAFTYEGMRAQSVEFPMERVNQIREKNREFVIIVIGANGKGKAFKVKKKYFSELP